jgi:DNA-binding transcriptional LysR family regulator
MEAGLDLDVIRAFLAVAREGSFSRAAERIHRTQAAVSQQVQRLERSLGARLFARTTRNVTLTVEGVRFLPFAERLIQTERQARTALAGTGDARPRLRIGVPDELMERVLAALRPDQDGMPPTFIRTGATQALIRRLDDDLDAVVGFTFGQGGEHPLLARLALMWLGRTLYRDPLPLGLYSAGCLMRSQAIAALDRAGLAWIVALEASSVGAIIAAAQGGVAVGVLPAICAPHGMERIGNLPTLPSIDIRLWTAAGLES